MKRGRGRPAGIPGKTRAKINEKLNPKITSRRQLSSALNKRTVYSIQEANQIVDHVFDIITEELYKMKEVNIVNFGRFKLYKNSPRPVRNMVTMEEMMLTEHFTVQFKPASNLKKRIKEKTEVKKEPDGDQ